MSFLRLRVSTVVAVLMASTTPAIFAQTPPPAVAPSTAVRINASGTITIKAANVPVQSLIEAIRPVCAMDVRFEPNTGSRPVTIEVANLAPVEAVSEVLKASGLDFGMHTSCGTAVKPSLILVSESGRAPVVTRALPLDPDDRRFKEADLAPPPPPAGPELPPEPEKRDDHEKSASSSTIGGLVEQHELAPGEITGAQLLERLSARPAAPSTSAVIELPFTDQNGQPYLQIRPAKTGWMTLPFPDANGNVVEVPIPTGPKSQTADFPVVRPDAAQPATPASSRNPADARKPGGGGLER